RELRAGFPDLADALETGRRDPDAVAPAALSEILTRTAPHVSAFLARLFPVEAARRELATRAEADAVLGRFKRDFLLRRAMKAPLPPEFPDVDIEAVAGELSAFERRLFPE